MSRQQRPACAHCDKLLNDEEYAVVHLTESHGVEKADARDAVESWQWPGDEVSSR